MDRNKGFTLVEMLAVVVIISILSLIAIGSVTKYLYEGKFKFDKSLENQIYLAGKNYFADYPKERPTELYDSTVTMKELLSKNLLEKSVIDSEGKNCDMSYVLAHKKDGSTNSYEYKICKICENDNIEINEDCIPMSKVQIIFDLNGGKFNNIDFKGKINEEINSKINLPTGNDITKDGYVFEYFETVINDENKVYTGGTEYTIESIPNNRTIVFKAIWITEEEHEQREIDKDTTAPEKVTLTRNTCSKDYTAIAEDNESKISAYQFTTNKSSEAWISVTPQTNINITQAYVNGATYYFCVKNRKGLSTCSSPLVAWTACQPACRIANKNNEVITYWWGDQKSNNCGSSSHSRSFDFRWYNCTCGGTHDNYGNLCGTVTQKQNTSHDNNDVVRYTSETACKNAWKNGLNRNVKSVCASSSAYGLKAPFYYHGYRFFGAGQDATGFTNFAVGGVWYHNKGNRNNNYVAGTGSYHAACVHACQVGN